MQTREFPSDKAVSPLRSGAIVIERMHANETGL